MASRRYTVVALTEEPDSELYGQTHEWSGADTDMGNRAHMESAQSLMWRAVDAEKSIYVYAFVRDNTDGMVVLERGRD